MPERATVLLGHLRATRPARQLQVQARVLVQPERRRVRRSLRRCRRRARRCPQQVLPRYRPRCHPSADGPSLLRSRCRRHPRAFPKTARCLPCVPVPCHISPWPPKVLVVLRRDGVAGRNRRPSIRIEKSLLGGSLSYSSRNQQIQRRGERMATKRRLQVFVSSTFTDLKEERQAAVSAILKAGHIPAGMELFTAGDQSQMTIIKRWIDESDVYMLILGGRYGSIEGSSGKSYTELEFDYAVEKNKPLFSVVMNDSALDARVLLHGRPVLELDNPKKLKEFRTKVLNYISSFFDDAKDIKLSVHESLSDFSANRELKGWVAADEVQDTSPLYDQIERLSAENISLREKAATLERQIQASQKLAKNPFEDLLDTLANTEIEIPETLTSDKKSIEMDVFSVFWSMQNRFLNGITNQAGMNETDKFLFFKLAPKLQIHGLVVNEKVDGAKYRRIATSKSGDQFLSFCAKRVAKTKKTSIPSVATHVPEDESESLKIKQKRAPRKKQASS